MGLNKYTISIYTEDNVGLLNRISAIFLKRHINIISITSSESEISNIFRFIIVVQVDFIQIKKLVKQIEKHLGLPANLGEMGISMDTPGIVENATTDVCTFTNPRPLEAKDYETLFEMAIG